MRCVWASRFSATGVGSLSPDFQPVAADPVRTLTLNGGDAARTSEKHTAYPHGYLCAAPVSYGWLGWRDAVSIELPGRSRAFRRRLASGPVRLGDGAGVHDLYRRVLANQIWVSCNVSPRRQQLADFPCLKAVSNPIGVATIEAIGMLNWPAERLKILSIDTINDVRAPPRWKGKLPMVSSLARLFMAGQSHSALGTAKIVTGDEHEHQAIWRVDQTAPAGRYTMDDAARIAEMKSRGFTEAREQLPELRRHFFERKAEPFIPFHSL